MSLGIRRFLFSPWFRVQGVELGAPSPLRSCGRLGLLKRSNIGGSVPLRFGALEMITLCPSTLGRVQGVGQLGLRPTESAETSFCVTWSLSRPYNRSALTFHKLSAFLQSLTGR